MDAREVERLKQVQKQALSETQANINKLKGFVVDYEALKQRLTSLPDKLSYDITVPLGRLAFMPGRLVHTAELLVLLGDDWFVERSARQACDIIDRRIQHLSGQVRDLEAQKGLIAPRLEFTSELHLLAQGDCDVQEILEPYDEEKERLWREQRTERRREEARQRSKQQGEEHDKQQGREQGEDRELWKRLEELEQAEALNNELNSDLEDGSGVETGELVGGRVGTGEGEVVGEGDVKAGVGISPLLPHSSSYLSSPHASLHSLPHLSEPPVRSEGRRSVTWDCGAARGGSAVVWDGGEECSGEEGSMDSESGGEGGDQMEQGGAQAPCRTTIQFRHTAATSSAVGSVTSGLINSPADIFRHFCPPPKSILKPSRQSSAASGSSLVQSAALNDGVIRATSQSHPTRALKPSQSKPSSIQHMNQSEASVEQSFCEERAPFCVNVVERGVAAGPSSGGRTADCVADSNTCSDSARGGGDSSRGGGDSAGCSDAVQQAAAGPVKRVSKFKASRLAQSS